MIRKYGLLAVFWAFLVAISIYLTPAKLALESDALGYWQNARTAVQNGSLFSQWVKPIDSYGDYGYTFVLGLVMQLTSTDSVILMQIINYLFWLLAAIAIYQSLKFIISKQLAFTIFLFTLFSPVYLTFSAKLYSEGYAALGFALLLFGALAIIGERQNHLKYLLTYTLGGIILISTKSAFIFILLIPLLWGLARKRFIIIFLTVLVLLTTYGNTLSANGTGRSLLVSAIQTAKLRWSYSTIGACTVYYLSYPLGQALFPGYRGACHPNNPTPDMPMYAQNPYVIGSRLVDSEKSYTYRQAWHLIIADPVKCTVLGLSNLVTVVWFEGVYPSILLALPSFTWPFLYLFAKIALSLFLWYHCVRIIRQLSHKSWPTALLVASPLIYFAVIFGNLHEEQRYFYPLIPYMYFMLGLSLGQGKSI